MFKRVDFFQNFAFQLLFRLNQRIAPWNENMGKSMEIPVKIFPAKLIPSVVALVEKKKNGLPMVRCDGIDGDLLQFGLC